MPQVFVFELSPMFMDTARRQEPKGPAKWKAGYVSQFYVDEFDISFYDHTYPVTMITSVGNQWPEFTVTVDDDLKFTAHEIASIVHRRLNDMIVFQIPTKSGNLINRAHPLLSGGFTMTYLDERGRGYNVEVLPNGELDLLDIDDVNEVYWTSHFSNEKEHKVQVTMSTVMSDLDNTHNWSFAAGYRVVHLKYSAFTKNEAGEVVKKNN